MQTYNPILYIEINELNYIFIAGKYDENQNLRIIEKVIAPNNDIKKKKFSNIENATIIIKQNVELIESKLDYIFKDLTVIIDNFDYSCLNISGFKKLNGSQVLKENISYILNSLKLAVTESEKQKTILHIFNTKSVLDGNELENLPIGLFGNFYNHELTFFLIENNDLKNLNQIFDKSNLRVKKIILKSFNEGTQLIKRDNIENFFKLKFNKENAEIIFFENSSFRYSEIFDFGTNIILKDISKVCSINNQMIMDILSDEISNNNLDENEFLEEKYFTSGNYRKIRKKLIFDIAEARIDEVIKIIFNKNINIKTFKKNNYKVYFIIQDKIICKSFEEIFKSHLSVSKNSELSSTEDFAVDSSIVNAENLSIYGWKKEAIPIALTKNSLITRIFKSIFG